MYILSMDGKTLIKATTLSVTKNFGGKKEQKFAISAEREGQLVAVVAALYSDEKIAVDALEKAFQAFADGAKAYRFQ